MDEVPPDDGTTEQRSSFDTAAGALYEVALSSVTDPVSSTGHILRVRHFSSPTLVTDAILIELRQGASTVIASMTIDTPASSYATFTLNLSGPEIDNITDYGDLRVRGTTQKTTNHRLITTWIEFEVPSLDVAVSTGVVNVTLSAKAASINEQIAVAATKPTITLTANAATVDVVVATTGGAFFPPSLRRYMRNKLSTFK